MDLKARQQYPPDMVPQLPAPPMAFMQQLQQMQAAAQMQATVQQQLQASQPQQPQMQAQQSQPQPTAPQPQQPQQQPPQMQPLMQPQMPQPGEKCSTACLLDKVAACSACFCRLRLCCCCIRLSVYAAHSNAAVWQMLFVFTSVLHQILLQRCESAESSLSS